MAKSILIVDDEDLITGSLKILLKKEGYNVTIAKSGPEALEKVKAADFDLIISDIRMPGMDGIETIKHIRAYLEKSNKKSIPEILITGYADVDIYEQSIDLKIANYIYKPFENDEFVRTVRKNIALL